MHPTPNLAQLDELVSRSQGRELSVRRETVGVQRPLPASIELAAYRIVQEALTKVAARLVHLRVPRTLRLRQSTQATNLLP